MPRQPCIHHCTSEPVHFFGRSAELTLLDQALAGGEPSVLAMIGPGGQGKTAIVQHWLHQNLGAPHSTNQAANHPPDGVFLWSFYRGKDSDLCLRSLNAYAKGLAGPTEVSASYCVDHLLPLLRRERWAVVLDGTEVVQYENGPWFGRFIHPELGRLLEELASEPLPGVVVLTTRFPLPTLAQRFHARLIGLSTLDQASAVSLLRSLGVRGTPGELAAGADACGLHAKAVELLGTYLVWQHEGKAAHFEALPPLLPLPGASAEEIHVARVLAAFGQALPPQTKDILALATNFRQPPAEGRLLEYLASTSVHHLLHQTWQRGYPPFQECGLAWLTAQVDQLVHLRLLERVRGTTAMVIDAHPLVRSGFTHALGSQEHQQSALSRGGFLRGRPDRRPPATLEEARDEVELFHAHCDAGWWNEADSTLVALDNPKHRFLAPAFERDLLLRFFPNGAWRQPPLWPGFGRYRSLAICLEMLGQFADALEAYRTADAPLGGDALIALGRLTPLLEASHVAQPWQNLWQAYRAHALCLAGRAADGLALARSLVPIDIYEWIHVFECFLRAGALPSLDVRSLLYRQPDSAEHGWSALARQRMHADYLRLTSATTTNLTNTYVALLEAYDRGGLPFERALTRLSYARWLVGQGQWQLAEDETTVCLSLSQRHAMPIMVADAWELMADIAGQRGQQFQGKTAVADAKKWREQAGYWGPGRP